MDSRPLNVGLAVTIRSVVYHLIETKRLPSFKVGKTVCARRSKLVSAFERLEQEQPAA